MKWFIFFLALLFPFYILASTSMLSITKNGLLGYWTFDSRDMTLNVKDISGNNNNGTLGNFTSTTTVPGKLREGLSFNGSNNFVRVGATTYSSNAPFTVSVWVRPNTVTNNNMRIFDVSNAGDGFWLGMDQTTGNKYNLNLFNGGTVNVKSTTTAVIGEWAHVVATFDGTTGNIYVNGNLETSVAGGYNGGGTRFRIIGCPGNGNGTVGFLADCWNGSMDDVHIYTRALSSSEVRALYLSNQRTIIGTTKKNIVGVSSAYISSGLVGWWTFDGKNLIQNVADSSGQGNKGNLVGFTSTTTSAGKIGQGLNFNGTTGFVNVGNTITTRSVSFWIKPTTNTSSMINLTATAYITASAGSITATGFTSPTTYVNGKVGSTLTANAWNHIVVVDTAATSANAITFGKANGAFAAGIIDDVRIYNRTLSADEVRALYNSTK